VPRNSGTRIMSMRKIGLSFILKHGKIAVFSLLWLRLKKILRNDGYNVKKET